MPSIGDYNPKVKPLDVGQSVGPVRAPNLSQSGSENLSRTYINSANELSGDVTETNNLVRQTAGAVANFINQGFVEPIVNNNIRNQRMRQEVAQSRQNRAQARLETMNQDAMVSAQSVPLMYQLHDLTNSVSKANPDNPDEWSQNLRDKAPDVIDNFFATQGIDQQSPVGLKLREGANSYLEHTDGELVKAIPAQMIRNTDAATQASATQAINAATDMGSLLQSAAAINGLRPALERLQGKDVAANTIIKYKREATMNALEGEANKNPRGTLDMLDKAADNFNHLLREGDVDRIRSKAQTNLDGQERTADMLAKNAISKRIENLQDIRDTFTRDPSANNNTKAKAINDIRTKSENDPDPKVREEGAKLLRSIEGEQTQKDIAAAQKRQAAAAERSVITQQWANEAHTREEAEQRLKTYRASEPIIKERLAANVAYENAYHMPPKITDPAEKVSRMDSALRTLDAIYNKQGMPDGEYLTKRAAIQSKRDLITTTISKPPDPNSIQGAIRNLQQNPKDQYFDALYNSVSPDVISFRGHNGNPAAIVQDKSEFSSRLVQYMDAFHELKGLKVYPTAVQLKAIIDKVNLRMKVEGPQY